MNLNHAFADDSACSNFYPKLSELPHIKLAQNNNGFKSLYIVTTINFQKKMKKEFGLNWRGGLSFEKVTRYLPHFKSAIQVPIYVIGLDL
jgi:hypothetical protein